MPEQNTIKYHKTIPILVLENERRKKKRIAYHLQNMVENADITTFKSLAKTRKYIREGGLADIFFCDLDIQDGDGFLDAQELQHRNPKANIIFADEDGKWALDAFEIFASGYILKPFTSEDIRHELMPSRLRYSLPINFLPPKNYGIMGIFGADCPKT